MPTQNRQQGSKIPGGFIMIPTSMLYSEAWQGLTSTAKDFYLLLRGEARYYSNKNSKKTAPQGRTSMPVIKNNGELRLTYRQAQQNLHKSSRSIADAVDSLLERGFLDIARPGGGRADLETLYALSDRWKRYGAADFVPAPPRPTRNTAGREALARYNRGRAARAETAKTTPGVKQLQSDKAAGRQVKDSKQKQGQGGETKAKATATAQMVNI